MALTMMCWVDLAERCRAKADAIRAAADRTTSREARRLFLQLAQGYERLAHGGDDRHPTGLGGGHAGATP